MSNLQPSNEYGMFVLVTDDDEANGFERVKDVLDNIISNCHNH